jgi:ABC-type Fe3+-hydroxamate transport system substrate-binding protein
MKAISLLTLSLAFALGACASTTDSADAKSSAEAVAKSAQNDFGKTMPEGEATPLAVAMQNADANVGKAMKISGRIGSVCQAKGCWLMLTDDDAAVRVKFGDHAFFIPKDSKGEAVAYGNLETVEMSEAQAKHMAEDAGADPSKVTGAQKEYRFIANSLHIKSTPDV